VSYSVVSASVDFIPLSKLTVWSDNEWLQIRKTETLEVSNGDSKAGSGITRSVGSGEDDHGLVHSGRRAVHRVGMFAIIEPGVAGLGVTMLVGWLLTFGGVTHLIAALKGDGAKQAIFRVIIGIVYLIAGLYFVTHPRLAIGTLTLLLASALLVGGVLEIIAYFRSKGDECSRWMLLNGMVALALGEMIWFQWPSSSVWAIGILVGLNLLMTGMTRLMFGLAARKLVRQAAG
jgi:uncharacterized membrane protein HdeD (DUF308 family)